MENESSDDRQTKKYRAIALVTAALAVTACGSGKGSDIESPFDANLKPAFLGAISQSEYNGVTDDLLTAGLGKTGLAKASAPDVANPSQPTAAELRRLAIYNNYRAIVDVSASGGFGSLYGPNIDAQGNDTSGEGKIAGTEYIAYADDGSGRQNVTMMVQVPAAFNPARPCIVTGTSSGSRGVYGAIGSSGEWGLKHGCAVAYNDKGTGNGIHDLLNNTVHLQNGTRASATSAGSASNFTADLTEAERNAFNAATRYRFAFKHAHSQQNPEKDWGKWTLQSIEFAFYVLNQKYGEVVPGTTLRTRTIASSGTIVIGSSISNGATAAIAAAEQDTEGLIDGIAVSEPNLQLAPDNRIRIVRGTRTWFGTGKISADYFTLANLLEPCAALAPAVQNAPFRTLLVNAVATGRCNALRTAGLISGASTDELATSALNALIAAGWEPESNLLHVSHYLFAIPNITSTYSNAYGRFSVKDNLCGFSFGATAQTGLPVPASSQAVALSFGTANGIPPTIGINIINNNSVGGPMSDPLSITPGTGQRDYNIDGALCQRELATGSSIDARRVQQGMSEVLRSANLRGKPALIVHGRSDTLIPVPFNSRPYFGINRLVEGSKSKLSYIEVTNAQHFDSFLSFAGYDSRFIPLHWYYIQAMDLMYAHLSSGAALPPSQLVRTTPRGVNGNGISTNPISIANVPPIRQAPAARDRITFADNVVTIPD
jgi:hydroxybutyrate-dimer hydrolase